MKSVLCFWYGFSYFALPPPSAPLRPELEALDLLLHLDNLHIERVRVHPVLELGREVPQVAKGGHATGAAQQALHLKWWRKTEICAIAQKIHEHVKGAKSDVDYVEFYALKIGAKIAPIAIFQRK